MRIMGFLCGLCLLSSGLFAADEAEYYYSEAKKCLSAGQTKEAANYFEHAIQSNPNLFYVIQENGALEKLLQSESKEAVETVSRMCEESRQKSKIEDPFVLYYSGWAHWILGKRDQAKKELGRAKDSLKKQGVDFFFVDERLKTLSGETPEAPVEKKEPHKTESVGFQI